MAIASVLAGLTESGILTVIAQVAATLVGGQSGVQFAIGPLQSDASVGTLLTLALGLALGRLALQVMLAALPARIAADMQARFRTELFVAFTQASWDVQARDREGHLQETLTNQVGEATAGIMQAMGLISALSAFLVLVISALVLNVAAALIVLGAAVGLFALLRPLSSRGNQQARMLSRAYMNYAGGINEAVRLAEETQVFGASTAQRERISQLLDSIRHLFFYAQLLSRLAQGVYQSLVYVLVVAALASLYLAGSGQVASLGAVVLLLVRAGTYGQQIQASHQALRQTLPYVERLQEAQRRYVTSSLPVGERPLEKVQRLTFEDVSFAYERGRPVLSSISFDVNGGEAIGIVGPSGAGKSTLVQILLRLRTPQDGRYLVNGTSVDQFSSRDWHRRIAYVPQEPRLLHASVADNIRFFRAIDDSNVYRAGELAGIHDEIMTWPHGYQTLVGPRADAVSGGQQQRISLARALAAEPAVLVLDEPTSALDRHSELLIQRSLTALKHQLTLFIVAHRISTLSMCERVMVIVDGELAGFDSPNLLESDNDYYRSVSALTVT